MRLYMFVRQREVWHGSFNFSFLFKCAVLDHILVYVQRPISYFS